jgi:hypothetical protein
MSGDTGTMLVAALLSRAKAAIAAGEKSLREAAEDIAAAQEQGATQRNIAATVGRSAAWVNRLLAWRTSGFKDNAFGSAHHKERQSAQRVHPGEHKEKPKTKPATTSEQAQRARAEAETAKAEAAKAKAEAARARAEAARARSEHAKARADARRAAQDAFANIFDGRRERKILHSGPRELLIKALGMLGSEHDGEILAAARAAEAQRRKLGMTWEELLISADETERRKAA